MLGRPTLYQDRFVPAAGASVGAGNNDTGLAYNPASQIVTEERSNDAYLWNGAVAIERDYQVNGLNQYQQTSTAGQQTASFLHDANGNLTQSATQGANGAATNYLYDVENRLVSASGGATATLRYDPLGRLYEVAGTAGTTRFLYDGDELVAEYGGGGAMLRRYVHGLGSDDPLVWYEGSDFSQPRYLHTNHQGSVTALATAAGQVLTVNSYDEYGIPGSANQGRFQYTGQAWLPELGLYYYKARVYSPTLGRFLQVDPIGYEDQVNLYAYVGNNPVNAVDPEGTVGRVIVSGAKIGHKAYKYRNSGGLGRATREVAAGVRNDWQALDNRSKASGWEKLKAAADLVLGTELYNGPFDTKGGGKIDGNADPSTVGDSELDAGIGQLEKSIGIRKAENASFPRGNPNSPDPKQRELHRRYQGHKQKTMAEEVSLGELKKRKDALGNKPQ